MFDFETRDSLANCPIRKNSGKLALKTTPAFPDLLMSLHLIRYIVSRCGGRRSLIRSRRCNKTSAAGGHNREIMPRSSTVHESQLLAAPSEKEATATRRREYEQHAAQHAIIMSGCSHVSRGRSPIGLMVGCDRQPRALTEAQK